MEKMWWHSQKTDHEDANDSGSDMNNEPPRSLPDKDFTSDPPAGKSVFAMLLVLGLPAVIFGGAGVALMVFSIRNPDHEDGGLAGVVCFGIPFSFIGLLLILTLRAALSTYRLRVQHSIDRLVFESSFLGRGYHSEDRSLSEAVYLEYTESWYERTDEDGRTTRRMSVEYIVHGHSSEEGEWELGIEDLILRFENHRGKAGEIAEAIGIEFRESDATEGV